MQSPVLFSACPNHARCGNVRSPDIKISPLCDREKDTDLPKNQMGFFQFVALPFYTQVARLLPDASALLDACKDNMSRWEELMNSSARSRDSPRRSPAPPAAPSSHNATSKESGDGAVGEPHPSPRDGARSQFRKMGATFRPITATPAVSSSPSNQPEVLANGPTAASDIATLEAG
jgi:hypothetical protein